MMKKQFKYIILILVLIAASIVVFVEYKKPDKNFQSVNQILQMHGATVVESPKRQGPFHILAVYSTQEGKPCSGSYDEMEYHVGPIPEYQVGAVILETKDGEIDFLTYMFK